MFAKSARLPPSLRAALCRLVLGLVLCQATQDCAAAPSAWSHLAKNDIDAIHDLLRDNHPGPPNPSDPRYRNWLARGHIAALARARTAHTYDDYLPHSISMPTDFPTTTLPSFLR